MSDLCELTWFYAIQSGYPKQKNIAFLQRIERPGPRKELTSLDHAYSLKL